MPGWIENKQWPGKYEGEESGEPTAKEIEARYPEYKHLNNERYSRVMGDYLACTSTFLHEFAYW